MRHLLLTSSLAALLTSSCATDTTFVVDNARPGSTLVVNERSHPLEPAQPVVVSVETGTDPVPWRVERGGVVVGQGVVERTEIEWGVVAGGTAMAACCMPSGAVLGFCIANPSLFAAPFTIALGDAGSVVNTFQSPGWASVPFVTAGVAAGAIPLLLGMVAQSPADIVSISLPVTSAAPAPTPTVPTNVRPKMPFLDDTDVSQPLPPEPAAPDQAMPPPSTPSPTPSLNRPSTSSSTTPSTSLRDEAVKLLPPAATPGMSF